LVKISKEGSGFAVSVSAPSTCQKKQST